MVDVEKTEDANSEDTKADEVMATAEMPSPKTQATPEVKELTDAETKARKSRNLAIGLGVTAFILVLYLTTIFRFTANNAVTG